MSKQDSDTELQNSIVAAQRYISIKEEYSDRHEAHVNVSINGKEHRSVKTVFVKVTNENVEVIIEDLHTLCSDNRNTFNPKTDIISVVNNTLQIKPKKPFCGLSCIEITAK